MSEGKPISVRFSPEIIQRLDAAALKTGISARTTLVKICVSGFLEYFERTGMAGLPINYKEIIHDLDGRSQRYRDLNINAQQSVIGGNMMVAETPSKYGTRLHQGATPRRERKRKKEKKP